MACGLMLGASLVFGWSLSLVDHSSNLIISCEIYSCQGDISPYSHLM
jgi:hypothetical protein